MEVRKRAPIGGRFCEQVAGLSCYGQEQASNLEWIADGISHTHRGLRGDRVGRWQG